MRSLVYLTNLAPSKMADDLSASGYRVWEALSVSEVLHLCEHERVDAVVIAAEMREEALFPVRLKHVTISLEPQAKTADLIWELEQLFPRESQQIR